MPITGFSAYPTRDMTEDAFDDAADTFIREMEQFVIDANALELSCQTYASNASTSASGAASSASSAASSAADANTYAGQAFTYKNLAYSWATQAAGEVVVGQGYSAYYYAQLASGYAATALNAPGTSATSTTSLTIGTGDQSLTIQTGKLYVPGQPVIIARTSAPATTWMSGVVKTYNSGTGALVVTVATSYTLGSGTFTDWTISLTAAPVASWPWSAITGKPTTKAGYGITDVPSFTQTTYNLSVMSATAPTLPDLTLGFAAVNVTAPSNATAVPTTVNTSDGWSIATGFVAATLRTIASAAYATAHGVWPGCTMTPPTKSTFTAAGTVVPLGVAQLDTNLVVYLYRVSTTAYVAAYNTSTNTWGTPVALTGSAQSGQDSCATIHKVTTTSFVATYGISGPTFNAQAGSVNTGTLAITTGTAVSGPASSGLNACSVSLSASLYIANVDNANDFVAYSVSGTTVTMGSAVSSGSVATSTRASVRMLACTATSVLIVYYGTGGGTSGTRTLSSRIASVSGTTITMNAATNEAAGNVYTQSNMCGFVALTTGSQYLLYEMTSTRQAVWAITVSGTTVTFATSGSVAAGNAVNTQVADQNSTWFSQPGKNAVRYSSTQAIFTTTGGMRAIQYSGGVVTVGSIVTTLGQATFLADPSAATFIAVGTTDSAVVTVATATITLAATFTATLVALLPSSTVSDKAVKYSSTWYAWSHGITYDCALSAAQWMAHSGANVTVYGDVT